MSSHRDHELVENTDQITRDRNLSVESIKSSIFGDEKLINLDQANKVSFYRNTAMMMGIFLFYVSFGMIIFHLFMGWDFLETMYFICITFSTVGYGDLTVDHTPIERSFTSAYLLVGLIAIASTLSIYLQILTDKAESIARQRSEELAKDIAVNTTLAANKFMRTFTPSISGIGRSISRTLSLGSNAEASPAGKELKEGNRTSSLFRIFPSDTLTSWRTAPENEEDNENRLTAVTEKDSIISRSSAYRFGSDSLHDQENIPVESKQMGALSEAAVDEDERESKIAQKDNIPEEEYKPDVGTVADPDDAELKELGNDEENFRRTLDIMRERQSKMTQYDNDLHVETMEDIIFKTYDIELRRRRFYAAINALLILAIIAIGTCCMAAIEGWDFNIAFYWACQTVTTVGYGDFPPNSRNGKVFTVFYIMFGLGSVATAITHVVEYPMALRAKNSEAKVLNQFGGDLSNAMLNKIFHSEIYERHPDLQVNKNVMSKSEFIILLLQTMNKVDEKDIVLASRVFNRLDVNGDGTLSVRDMEALKEQARQREEEQRKRAIEDEERRRQSMIGVLTSPLRVRGSDGTYQTARGSENTSVMGTLSAASRRFSIAASSLMSYNSKSKGSEASDSRSRHYSADTESTYDRRTYTFQNSISASVSRGSSGLESFLDSNMGSPEGSGHQGQNVPREAVQPAVGGSSSPLHGSAGDPHGHTLRAPLSDVSGSNHGNNAGDKV